MSKTILVTGAEGFVASAIIECLSEHYTVVGTSREAGSSSVALDITDHDRVCKLISDISPDVIVHCAAIAHQKVHSITRDDYFNVNAKATVQLFKEAVIIKENVHFVFLSSVTVYGEGGCFITENTQISPSGDYAESKLEAERLLSDAANMYPETRVDILRLAPVYDKEWALNLERRVFAPAKKCYLKFGNGTQKISALSRQNLVGFIFHLITNDLSGTIYNVCDKSPYSFNAIINVFKSTGGNKKILPVPHFPIWLLTRLAGILQKSKKEWWFACYDKLFKDLTFDNKKMVSTGFKHKYTIQTVFGLLDNNDETSMKENK